MLGSAAREKLEGFFDSVVGDLALYFDQLHMPTTNNGPSLFASLCEHRDRFEALEFSVISSEGYTDKIEEFRKEFRELWKKGDSLGEAVKICLEDYIEGLRDANDELLEERLRVPSGALIDWHREGYKEEPKKYEKHLINQIRLKGRSQLPDLLELDDKRENSKEILEELDFDWRSFRSCHCHIGLNNDEFDKRKPLLRRAVKEPGYFFLPDQELIDRIIGINMIIGEGFNRTSSKNKVMKLLDQKTEELQDWRYNSSRTLDRLREMGWGPENYIVPDDEIVQRLIDTLESKQQVTITGKGGIGKTALANSYILRNLSGDMEDTRIKDERKRIKAFERVVYLSTKSFPQGDFDPMDLTGDAAKKMGYRLDPATIERSAAYHIPVEFAYARFLQDVGGLFRQNIKSRGRRSRNAPEAEARSVLESNRVLVILDNFEDIQDEAPDMATRFYEFFNTVNLAVDNSRIIITSRKETQPDQTGPTIIPVPVLEQEPRFRLLQERMRLLLQREICQINPRSFEFFIAGEGQKDSYEAIMKRVDKNGSLTINTSYPYVLFRFAKVILDAYSKGGAVDFSDAVNIVLSKDQDPKFTEYIDSVDDWAIQKSLTNYFKDESSLEYRILEELFKSQRGKKRGELSKVLKEDMGTISRALDIISFDRELIQYQSTDTPIVLTNLARKVMKKNEKFREIEAEALHEDRKPVDEIVADKLRSIFRRIKQVTENRGSFGEELKDSIRKSLGPDSRLDRRKEVNEDNLILAINVSIELRVQIEHGIIVEDSEILKLIDDFEKMIFEGTLRIIEEKGGGNRPDNHLRAIVEFLRIGSEGAEIPFGEFSLSKEECQSTLERVQNSFEHFLSANECDWAVTLPHILKGPFFKPDKRSSDSYWKCFISLVIRLEENNLIDREDNDLHLIVIERIREDEAEDYEKEFRRGLEGFLGKVRDNNNIELHEDNIVFFDKLNIFREKGEWKGEMATGLERFDVISIKEDDWRTLGSHLRYTKASLNGIPAEDFYTKGRETFTRWVVEKNVRGSMALLSIPEEDDSKISEERQLEIRETVLDWIERRLEKAKGARVRLSTLESDYEDDKGITLRAALSGTGLGLSNLAGILVKREKAIHTNTNDGGGMLKLSQTEHPDLMRELSSDQVATQTFLRNWRIPEDHEERNSGLRLMRTVLSGSVVEDWNQLKEGRQQWISATIGRASQQHRKEKGEWRKQRGKSKTKNTGHFSGIRIDERALFDILHNFVITRAGKREKVNDKIIHSIFGEWREYIPKTEEILSIDAEKKKANAKDKKSREAKEEEEADLKQKREKIKAGSKKGMKGLNRMKRMEKYGPIAAPEQPTFKLLVQDYLEAMKDKPANKEEFEESLTNSVKRRIDVSRQRQVSGIPGLKKTDDIVWKAVEENLSYSLGISEPSTAITILAEAIASCSELSRKEAMELIKSLEPDL